LSLDKWIKSDKKKEAKKKPEEIKKKQVKKDARSNVESEKTGQEKKKDESTTLKMIKHRLICSKKGCNYQKTIVKKQLNEKDTTCPRCKSKMNTN